ncbi:MAG: putative bifunctional diguanylate cyclase/phosphodiesterase [Gammaproteobacteria bacterium]
MNLNKRALLVITPVVLLSFIVASMIVYEIARNFLERQEQYRLNNAVTQLASVFGRYKTFSENFLLTVTQSHALNQYLQFPDDASSEFSLVKNLEHSAQEIDDLNTEYLSITFGTQTPSLQIRSHVELSQDPFSEISAPLEDYVLSLFTQEALEQWDYIATSDTQSLLVKTQFINPVTFARPLASQLADSIAIAVAIDPTEFNTLRASLEEELNTRFIISTIAQTPSILSASTPILEGRYLQVTLPRDHLQQQLMPLAFWLLLISLIFSATASICLFGLINRHITRPILELERDLSDVLSSRQNQLPKRHMGDDEIGALAQTFNTLYQSLAHSYDETRRLMERDTLTGLYNLSYINQIGQDALNHAKGTSDQIALLVLDLDNFKFVNDKYGHRFGDQLLSAFSQSLSDIAVIRSSNIDKSEGPYIVPGRVAGDQFCLLIKQAGAADAALEIAQMILHQMEEGLHFAKSRFPITSSIGIALFPQDADSFSQLISNADTAVHQAKVQGKNQVAYYSEELAQQLRRRQEVENALKHMNPDLEFRLVYMPLLNVKTGELDGFEALLRWNSRKLGNVEPDEFVPIAESCGVYEMIDEWVISKGLSSYPAIRKLLGRDFKMSLNISSAQLQFSELTELLARSAKRYDIAPKYIQIEITETVNIEYTPHARQFLKKLADTGYLLALDDFGAGFTSLLRIVEYPITMVKFDKGFIEQTLKRGNRQILKPLVELCHSNGMQVTMEGAESQEDVDMLSTFDCDFIQGYFLGLPTTLEDMEDALRKLRQQHHAESL